MLYFQPFLIWTKLIIFAVGTASQIGEAASRKKIWGIMGIIRLLSCRYLLVITEAEKVGTIAGHTIYRIAGSEMVRYETSSLHLSEKQWESNETYVEMIQTVLNTPHFYFSYTYDLSHRMQKLHNTTPEFLQVPFFVIWIWIYSILVMKKKGKTVLHRIWFMSTWPYFVIFKVES